MEGKTTTTLTPKQQKLIALKTQEVTMKMRKTIKESGRERARDSYLILLKEIENTPEHVKGIYAAAYKEVFEVQNED